MTHDLWYGPSIPGRGEFVRLVLEAASLPCRDRARDEGEEALMTDMAARCPRLFASPYLIVDGAAVSQVANVCRVLTERHDLAPRSRRDRLSALQLTLADLVTEAHDTHHPIGPDPRCEDAKPEALRRSETFRAERMLKFLDHFDHALGDAERLGVDRWSPPDLGLFQVIEGLRYAFPRRMATLEEGLPRLAALRDCLASDRRIPFNQDGLFRRCPELDGD